MNTIYSRFARTLVASAIAASSCIALVGVSHAQTPPNADTRAPAPQMGPGMQGEHGMRGMHRMHMMRELSRLKTSLRLAPEQTALWDRAEQQMKPPADMREQMKARHDRMAAMLDDPNFDPRKFAAETDSMQAERVARHKSMREAWFAVYDKLNAAQRGQVREFLRSHMSHRQDMGERMREHMGRKQRGPQAGQDKPAPGPASR